MSRLSRQCGILNISQPYRPPRPVTGMALLSTLNSVSAIGPQPTRLPRTPPLLAFEDNKLPTECTFYDRKYRIVSTLGLKSTFLSPRWFDISYNRVLITAPSRTKDINHITYSFNIQRMRKRFLNDTILNMHITLSTLVATTHVSTCSVSPL
jgi:hypothetical protein